MATSPGWDVRHALTVAMRANTRYWVNKNNYVPMTFFDGACGLMWAAKDYNYPKEVIINAFARVGIQISEASCPKN